MSGKSRLPIPVAQNDERGTASHLLIVGRKSSTDRGSYSQHVEVVPLESKRVPGLFLAGELLDLDGPIGGYNFQAAWSTGWLAGTAAAG